MHRNLLNIGTALVVLALMAPAASAHNGGASGICGVVACRSTVVLNGCGAEAEAHANVGNPST